jgi:hypothetical protein
VVRVLFPMRPGSTSPFRPRELEMQLRILPPVLTFFLRVARVSQRAKSARALFASPFPLRSLLTFAHSLRYNSESLAESKKNMKRNIYAHLIKRVSSSLSAKREGIKCHIYIHAESERAPPPSYIPLSLSFGACVPVREPPTTTRNEPPPPNNALCSVRFIAAAASARSGTRFPESQSKKGKNIKRSAETGCMDFELGKTSVKMAFRSLCSRRISLLTGSSVCF